MFKVPHTHHQVTVGLLTTVGQVLPTASTQFHTYGLIWNEDELIFSVDGVVHYTYNPPVKNSDTWPFDAEQYLLLNLAIESDISPTFQQGTLEIDYVRVYEPSTDPAGCMDVNATNYDSEATIQEYDQWGNILCVYATCDDILISDVFMQMDLQLSMKVLMPQIVNLMVEHHVKKIF